jgi:SAM-dependent methyltransferase
VDVEEYRRESLANWDKIAGNWDREREWLWSRAGEVGERLVERLDPQPGETILELAAGTGDTGFAAARKLGDQGRLISTDFAPAMVEAARRVADGEGLSNVEFRVLDAEDMDLDDDSVDGVLCRWGYMLMADPATAFAETRRVLRDTGRLEFSVWGSPERNQWVFIPGLVLVEAGHMPPPEPGQPGIFALAEPDRIRELVTGSGFGEPEIEEMRVGWGYDDPEVHWHKVLQLAAPLADTIGDLPEDEQDRVRGEAASRVQAVLDADSDGLDGHCWVVSAR